MDDERRGRYRDKIALARERSGDVRGWTAGAASGSLAGDKKTRLAVYKALQELIEAVMDLCAMRVADVGAAPKDDYSNLALLRDRGLLSAEAQALLKEANGLRNRLVHSYNHIEDDRVLQFIRDRLDLLDGLLAEVQAWT